MNEVKTYAVNCNDAWLNTNGDDISGSYVKYADYLELAVQLANAESKCRELAAENAEMRSSIDATIGWQESTDPENGESVRMLVDIKTPATDAFLAEVRAQGVEIYADNLDSSADDAERDGFDDAVKFLRSEASGVRLFAAQLRQEAAQ
ncbi:hypothetical protein [Citrobacter sp. Cb127]|uniref:hypothetical protein n=1 Tax=Citrobacter sp. Cb127 TaxID=2985032 RepID=UPI00257B5CBF|nr:hypothetical protein [Citrobacter sp. Cb127]MDM3332430.1 hypothetical protein [Citrobacter sp. Cb127]